jgi:hypothetical protein
MSKKNDIDPVEMIETDILAGVRMIGFGEIVDEPPVPQFSTKPVVSGNHTMPQPPSGPKPVVAGLEKPKLQSNAATFNVPKAQDLYLANRILNRPPNKRDIVPVVMEGIAWDWQSIDGALVKAPLAITCVGANPTDRGKKWAQAKFVSRRAWRPAVARRRRSQRA